MFLIELDNGHILTAHISGALRARYTKILPGYRVKVLISFSDFSKGKIVQVVDDNVYTMEEYYYSERENFLEYGDFFDGRERSERSYSRKKVPSTSRSIRKHTKKRNDL